MGRDVEVRDALEGGRRATRLLLWAGDIDEMLLEYTAQNTDPLSEDPICPGLGVIVQRTRRRRADDRYRYTPEPPLPTNSTVEFNEGQECYHITSCCHDGIKTERVHHQNDWDGAQERSSGKNKTTFVQPRDRPLQTG